MRKFLFIILSIVGCIITISAINISYNGMNYKLTNEDPYEARLFSYDEAAMKSEWNNNLIIPDDIRIFTVSIRITEIPNDLNLDTLRIPRYLKEIPQYWFDWEDDIIVGEIEAPELVVPKTKIKYYDVSDLNENYSSYKGNLYSKSFKTFKECPYHMRWNKKYMQISDFHPDVEKIDDYALFYMDSVALSRKVKKIENKSFSAKNLRYLYIDPENPFLSLIGQDLYNMEDGKMIVRLWNVSVENVIIPKCLKELKAGTYSGMNVNTLKIYNPNVKIGSSAFEKTPLQNVEFPEGFKTIAARVFRMTDLKEIDFPNSLEEIGDYAFQKSKLVSVILPANLKTMGIGVFDICPLENIKSLSTVPPAIADDTFNSRITDSVILYVPEKSLTAYKEAEGWKNFKNVRSL